MNAGRYIALWVPNWPLASLVAGTPPGSRAVIEKAGKVTIVTPSAARRGVRVGMTRTLAQYYCPGVVVLKHDPDRESGAFESLLEVFDSYAANVTVVRPGLAFAPAVGAAKWVGSEETLAEKIVEDIATITGAEAHVGIATGLGTALLAARKSLIVPDHKTEMFLGGLQLRELVKDLPEGISRDVAGTLETLAGLGVYTGADLERLGRDNVVSRFGQAGQILVRLVSGDQPAMSVQKRSEGDIRVQFDLDPPANQADHAVMAIARVSNDLADQLRSRGLFASSVQVILQSAGGRRRERTWTLLDVTSASQVTKRITWQLKGWLGAADAPVLEEPDPLTLIELIAVDPGAVPEVDPLWGGVRASWKAGQAAEQVQTLLGEESVLVPKLHGGFDPRTRISLIPWGQKADVLPKMSGEWDGGVSDPPVVLFVDPPSAMLMGKRFGSPNETLPSRLWITGRGMLNGIAHRVIVNQDRPELVAGDYPLSQVKRVWVVRGRWWNKDDRLRGPRCYARVSRVDGPDLLLVQRKGNWCVEGVYGTLSSVKSAVGSPLTQGN